MNVLDLRGPEFLRFYLAVLAVVLVAAGVLRRSLRHPGGDLPPGRRPQLHPLEVAYLSGGARGIIDAAIAGLVQRRHLGVDKIRRTLTVGMAPDRATPLEEAVWEAVDAKAGNVSQVRRAVSDMTRSATSRLQSLGLVVTDSQAAGARLLPALLVLAVMLLGVAKIVVGVERNRPVGFLVMLSAIPLVAMIFFIASVPVRTRRGDAVLARMKRQNAALQATAARAPNSLAGDDLSLAFALFGAGIFAWGPMADLRQTLAPPREGGSGCGGGSSCGGGSCGGATCGGGGGGCEGGGGCGGGGCGGCGGGS
jgi:uncharacterized protein (TIGR04222 family)